MAIERFTREAFEAALPKDKEGKLLWESMGVVSNEYVYSLKVNEVVRLVVRSSVARDGLAKDTAEDSIRVRAEVRTEDGAWRSLPKIDAYTTRVNGWDKRMTDKMRELWRSAQVIKRPVPICDLCHKVQPVWKVKAGPSKDRWCSKCIDCEHGFVFMDKEDEAWQEKKSAPSVATARELSSPSGSGTVEKSNGVEPVEPNSTATKKEKSSSAAPKKSESDKTTAEGESWQDEESGQSAQSAAKKPTSQPEVSLVEPSESAGTATLPISSSEDTNLTSDNDLLAELSKLAEDAFNSTPKIASAANSQQLKAIEAPLDKAVRVLAGPGSGKTFVIERRYAHLLRNGVKPQNIVAVTFSAAMAQELQSRILKHNKEVSGTGAENQICTIHALCARLLVAEGLGKQVPKTWQMKKLLQEIIAELWPYVADVRYARPGWDEVMNAIGNAKSRHLLVGQDAGFYEALWGEYHAKRLTEARKRFDGSMHAQGLWTFGDMLYECERLLASDRTVREKYQQRYQYVIIDEGQDTNHQAMRILTMLAQPQDRLFIVGDPDQLLFRFTGATPESNLYEGFTQRYPEGLMIMLETNYRSTKQVVEYSNRLIEKNYEGMGGPYNEVFHKVLNAKEDADDGNVFNYQQYDDPIEEANGIAEQVNLLIEQGYEPGDIFIGSRTRAQLGYLEGPMTKLGIKFLNITGGSFWQMSHIANTLAYLRLAVDHGNSEAFQRVYNIASAEMRNRDGEYCPTRYLGRAFLEEVENKYDERAMRMACSRRWAYTNGVEDLMALMQDIDLGVKLGVATAVQTIIDRCMFRYLQHEEGLDGSDSENSKLADFETVIDVARKYATVEEFLARVDEMIQAAQDARDKKWDDYVVLSTIHRLKGMERPVVFGMGWCEGEMIIEGHVIKVGLLPHTFSMTPPPVTGVLDMGSMSKMEDERCMAFVLVTRAKQEVYLSGVRFWRKAVMHPSRFIQEMGLV